MKALADELARHLTDLTHQAGREDTAERFNAEYEALFKVLKAGLQSMRMLAGAQAAWLKGKAGKGATWN